MALNVWIREEDLPKNRRLIDCNNAYFDAYLHELVIDAKVRQIVKKIDGATFIDDEVLYSKYGGVMGIRDLSAGCKVYLDVYTFKDKLFDTFEAGENVLRELIKLGDGNVLLNCGFYMDDCVINVDVHYRKRITHFDRFRDFYTFWMNVAEKEGF